MVQVTAGVDTTRAIDDAGVVWCWGLNDSLQLGRPTSVGSPNPNIDRTPFPVPAIPAMAPVAVGCRFACARAKDDSKVHCWGSNVAGTLGNGGDVGKPGGFAPVVALVPPGVVDISTGLNDHVCALTSAQQVWCWGSNSYGQLGHSSANDIDICPTTKCIAAPAMVATTALSGSKVSSSALGTCAESTTGFVCWGSNVYGQLGTKPDTLEHFMPAPVSQGQRSGC